MLAHLKCGLSGIRSWSLVNYMFCHKGTKRSTISIWYRFQSSTWKYTASYHLIGSIFITERELQIRENTIFTINGGPVHNSLIYFLNQPSKPLLGMLQSWSTITIMSKNQKSRYHKIRKWEEHNIMHSNYRTVATMEEPQKRRSPTREESCNCFPST